MNESAVSFPTPTRLHVSFGVRDLEAAVAFYSVLFGQGPTKRRADYAKFELLDPPANVSMVTTPDATPPQMPRHYGIQVKSRAAVQAAAERLQAAQVGTEREEGACCYADQDKVWAVDPDGNRWEVFVVLADAESLAPPTSACCAPSCCK
ncbi:MAG: ArsI/CadI family heavy metal resistance metalloenzyme [Planctomycetota bacterium]